MSLHCLDVNSCGNTKWCARLHPSDYTRRDLHWWEERHIWVFSCLGKLYLSEVRFSGGCIHCAWRLTQAKHCMYWHWFSTLEWNADFVDRKKKSIVKDWLCAQFESEGIEILALLGLTCCETQIAFILKGHSARRRPHLIWSKFGDTIVAFFVCVKWDLVILSLHSGRGEVKWPANHIWSQIRWHTGYTLSKPKSGDRLMV